MAGYYDDRQLHRAPESLRVDTVNDEEQYVLTLSVDQNDQQLTAVSFDGPPPHTQGYHPRGDGRTTFYSQATDLCQTQSFMTMQQHNGVQYGLPQGYGGQISVSSSSEYIDHGLLSLAGASHDQSPHSNTYDYQYPPVIAQSMNPSAYEGDRQGRQYSASVISNSDCNTIVSENRNREGQMFAGTHIGREHQNSTPAFAASQPDVPTEGSDSVFVPGVLDRGPDHRKQLKTYTDGLVHSLDVSPDNGQGYSSFATGYFVHPDPYAELRDISQYATIPPQFLTDVQGQRLQTDGAVHPMPTEPRASAFRYIVKESTPVIVDPNASDSQSK